MPPCRYALAVCLFAAAATRAEQQPAPAWGRHIVEPFDKFERQAREMILADEHKPLVNYERLGRKALLSIPAPDHYLPLLYVVAARQPGEAVGFPVEGVDGGSISMLAVKVG